MLRQLLLLTALGANAGCHVISPEHLKNAPPREIARAVPALPTSNKKAVPAGPAEDHLILAADCLAADDHRGAIKHLTRHVEHYPDQLVFRMQLGELLLKENQFAEAQEQYHQVCCYAQDGNASAKKQLVHAHTRLMEIAQARDDRFHEHLHRGIGLYRVAEQLQIKNADLEPGEIERMLFKAIAAFKVAQELQPNDARVAWYMHLAWNRLDQPRPAEKALRVALAHADVTTLTPAEARELTLLSSSR